MDQPPEKKSLLKSFPSTYWVVIVMEFFERSAFYGMMAMLADYFVENVGSTEQWGLMRTVLFVILYLVPIFSGALAEKVGYKKILGVAFLFMLLAYLGVGGNKTFPVFFGFMVVLGLGGGLFKPVISGTIARSTDKSNSTMGFGIYYWSINVGSFLTSLVASQLYDRKSFFMIFALSGVYVGLMFFNNIFCYREPDKPGKIKTAGDVFKGVGIVFMNWRFILLLLVFLFGVFY